MFETEFAVRDYECDIEGIVNNANYLHYTEHTRHLFLKSCGLSFADMHHRGVDAVVARMNLQFKAPLRPDDVMLSCLDVTREGLRYVFCQDIYRVSDGKLCLKSVIDIVCLVDGRLAPCADFDRAFGIAADAEQEH